MNSEIVILLSTVSTGLIALLGLLIRYSFLSKCIKIKCCCCEIERDIKHEISVEEHKDTPTQMNNNNFNHNNFNNNV